MSPMALWISPLHHKCIFPLLSQCRAVSRYLVQGLAPQRCLIFTCISLIRLSSELEGQLCKHRHGVSVPPALPVLGTQDAVFTWASEWVNSIPSANAVTAVGVRPSPWPHALFMQFSGETDKQTAALQYESAGKSVNRGSVLPRGWGVGLEMGEGRRQVGVGVGSRKAFWGTCT